MANNWVYFMLDAETNQVKIGQSNNPIQRLTAIRQERPSAELIAIIPAHLVERELHERYSHLREGGEWFRLEDDLREYIEESQRLPPIIIKESTPKEALRPAPPDAPPPTASVSTPYQKTEYDYVALLFGVVHLFGGIFLLGAASAMPNPHWNWFTVSSVILIFLFGFIGIAAFAVSPRKQRLLRVAATSTNGNGHKEAVK